LLRIVLMVGVKRLMSIEQMSLGRIYRIDSAQATRN